MSPPVDAIVVGAGAVGVSVAHELAQAGVEVTLLDADDDVGSGCSAANAGLLTPSHVEPLANPANVAAGVRSFFDPHGPFAMSPRPRLVPWMTHFLAAVRPHQVELRAARLKDLAARSLTMHQEYVKAGLATGFESSGVLDAYSTRKGFERAAAAVAGTESAQAMDVDSARNLEPSLGEVQGAVLHPHEAHCDGRSFVEAVAEAARRDGVDIRLGCKVERVIVKAGRVVGVQTSAGTLTAQHVIVASGVASTGLAASAGTYLPMQAGKGYMIDVTVAGDDYPRIPVSFKEQRVVTTPYPDRLRICGTFELTGEDTSIDQRRMDSVLASARSVLPRMEVKDIVQARSGLRPCSPDGLPYIGRTRAAENLVFATGHGMWGLTLGPVTGALITDAIVRGEPTLSEPSLSPDRFTRFTRRHERQV